MKFSAIFLTGESHAYPPFLAPDNTALLTHLIADNIQRDLMGNANWSCNLESGSRGGQVPNDAIDSRAVEFNRAGLEYSPS